MGKSTISMAIFNSYVSLPEGSFHKGQTTSSFWVDTSEKNPVLFVRELMSKCSAAGFN